MNRQLNTIQANVATFPHYPQASASELPAAPATSWLGGLTPSAASVRIGRRHVLAGWEMGELLDDRGDVIVVLPLRKFVGPGEAIKK